MKKAYLLILFISIASQVFGQNNCLNEMIIDCLHAYVNHGAELNNNNENENGIYICKDGLPLGFPYEKITQEHIQHTGSVIHRVRFLSE